jgi:hypothetical protein
MAVGSTYGANAPVWAGMGGVACLVPASDPPHVIPWVGQDGSARADT